MARLVAWQYWKRSINADTLETILPALVLVITSLCVSVVFHKVPYLTGVKHKWDLVLISHKIAKVSRPSHFRGKSKIVWWVCDLQTWKLELIEPNPKLQKVLICGFGHLASTKYMLRHICNVYTLNNCGISVCLLSLSSCIPSFVSSGTSIQAEITKHQTNKIKAEEQGT